MTIPALSIPQLIPALEMKEFNATGTVIFVFVEMSMTAMKSSFQIFTKQKLKIAAMPGRTTGTTHLCPSSRSGPDVDQLGGGRSWPPGRPPSSPETTLLTVCSSVAAV